MLYAFTENFVLPISHDEVVYGKRSLLSKMPGDEWQKFANARAFLAYMYGASGQEAAVHGLRDRAVDEWNHDSVGAMGAAAVRLPPQAADASFRELNACTSASRAFTKWISTTRASSGSTFATPTIP